MSMRDYGVNDYGLVLTSDDLEHIVSKLCDDYTEEAFTDDPWSFYDSISDTIDLEYIDGFTGDATAIDERGFDNWRGSYDYQGDCVFYIPLNRAPGLFTRAYGAFDEIVLEMRGRVGDYLPKDFNYRDNIRHIVGTYCG